MVTRRGWDTWKLILLFFCPALFVWLTAMVIPFLYGIFISFTKWDGIATEYTLIGFANYVKVFNTSKFWLSLQRTGIYTVGTVILSNVVGLILGLLLTSSLKGRNAFRTTIYVPNVVGGVAMGYIWQYIFSYGFTRIGQSMGIPGLSTSMLSDTTGAMVALVLVSSWQLSAYLMIIYVAGFTNVPAELVEAARVDGATSWGVFRNSMIDGSSSPASVREAYEAFLSRSPVKYKDPDILLYMILEFISGTSYNSILYGQPCPLAELKPHMYNGIRALLKSAEVE